jgi:alkylation response protein AidB-like acyl-CoA dehydrogenase
MTQTLITTDTVRYELPVEMLERFRARAGELDRTNTYFHDDLDELRSFGYLAAAVPSAFGGAGLDLAQMAASQRRLARFAPATALAMTMHTYWIGIATELERAGDSSLRWILEAAVAGEVFAAGHAEAGNDVPVLMSTCRPSGCRAATGSPVTSSSAPTGPSGTGSVRTPSTPTHPADRRSCTRSCTVRAPVSP